MKELVCIICPRGYHLTVDEKVIDEKAVTGNACPRGASYGLEEVKSHMRSVSSTCPVSSLCPVSGPADLSIPRRVPVKTKGKIPRALAAALVRELQQIKIPLPVEAGLVIIENWRGYGVPVVVTRTIKSE